MKSKVGKENKAEKEEKTKDFDIHKGTWEKKKD